MDRFKKLFLVLPLLLLIAGSAHAATNYWFSPLTAVAVGPSGSPSILTVSPASSPSTALRVTAGDIVMEDDFQWVLLGLTIPSGASGRIKDVEICYQVITSSRGDTYISQVRLTKMTTSDKADVIRDDETNLTETDPTCYKSVVNKKKVKGTITLALKMVFGSTEDAILIGGIRLRVSK